MYASGAMNRHIPGLTMSIALTGNFLRECPGIIKTDAQGLARTRIALPPTPRC